MNFRALVNPNQQRHSHLRIVLPYLYCVLRNECQNNFHLLSLEKRFDHATMKSEACRAGVNFSPCLPSLNPYFLPHPSLPRFTPAMQAMKPVSFSNIKTTFYSAFCWGRSVLSISSLNHLCRRTVPFEQCSSNASLFISIYWERNFRLF